MAAAVSNDLCELLSQCSALDVPQAAVVDRQTEDGAAPYLIGVTVPAVPRVPQPGGLRQRPTM